MFGKQFFAITVLFAMSVSVSAGVLEQRQLQPGDSLKCLQKCMQDNTKCKPTSFLDGIDCLCHKTTPGEQKKAYACVKKKHCVKNLPSVDDIKKQYCH